MAKLPQSGDPRARARSLAAIEARQRADEDEEVRRELIDYIALLATKRQGDPSVVVNGIEYSGPPSVGVQTYAEIAKRYRAAVDTATMPQSENIEDRRGETMGIGGYVNAALGRMNIGARRIAGRPDWDAPEGVDPASMGVDLSDVDKAAERLREDRRRGSGRGGRGW